MYRDSYVKADGKPSVYRKKWSKYVLIALSVLLLVGLASGGTLAYLFTGGNNVINRFVPGNVECVVNDNNTITVNGNTKAYVRAAVVINWENTKGEINGLAPVKDTDYTIVVGSNWTKESDGYYYYGSALTAGGTTISPAVTVTPKGSGLAGFSLSVEVLGEAIQSEGMGAVSAKNAWDIAIAGAQGS